jgi:serine/threonine protein kinase/tetratricopeptide (TPR) repeat protein
MIRDAQTLDAATEELLSELVGEFTDRLNAGQQPDVAEYVQRHPRHGGLLRELLEPLQALRRSTVDVRGGESPRVEQRVPDRLGDFRIVREVGRGGMGVVYEAVQESLGRHVALKVLPVHAVLDPTHLERFRREAHAAARLHHTNIVPVFGVGEQDGVHYFAMQFIEGQGLDEVLGELKRRADAVIVPNGSSQTVPGESTGTQSKAVSPADTLRTVDPTDTISRPGSHINYFNHVARIGVEVAEALAYAHSEGVQHRDIKPSNLLLDRHGTAWVTDFGLAKAEGSDDMTQTGDIVGTLRYLAPERFSGRSDERSDVYGLGLTLYELLTLRPAFDETDRSRLIRQITQTRPPAPRRLDRAIPRDLETIVLKAIDPDPHRRYASSAALAGDLRRFLDYLPIQARRSSALVRLGRWCRRNPALAAASGLALVALIGGLAATTWQWRRAEANLGVARDQQNRAEQAVQESERNRAIAEVEARRAALEAEHAAQETSRASRLYGLAYGAVDELRDAVADDAAFRQLTLQPLQRRVLGRALDFYEQLIVLQADDPKAKADVAANYVRIGRIKRTTGPIQEAIQAYQRAVELFGDVAETDPDVTQHREQLVSALNGLGFLLQNNGRFDDARQSFDRAIVVAEQLLSKQPTSAPALSGLALSYINLGYLLSQSGDGTLRERAERAIEVNEKARAIYEKLVRDNPESSPYANYLAVTYFNIANRLLDANRPAEALELSQKCLEIRLDNLGRDPTSFSARLGVATAHRLRGSMYRRFPKHFQEWFERGVPAYDRARELCEELLSENPTHLGVQAELGLVFLNLARIHSNHGDLSKALPFVERSIELYESCLAGDPENVDALESLANGCHAKGSILERSAHPQEAIEAFERAVQLQAKVVEMAPQATIYRDELRNRESSLDRARQAVELNQQ